MEEIIHPLFLVSSTDSVKSSNPSVINDFNFLIEIIKKLDKATNITYLIGRAIVFNMTVPDVKPLIDYFAIEIKNKNRVSDMVKETFNFFKIKELDIFQFINESMPITSYQRIVDDWQIRHGIS